MGLSQVRHKLDLGLLLGLVQVRPHMAHGGGIFLPAFENVLQLHCCTQG
jgi:hypothetical protein